jgi:biopolymer transport protein ExbD
MKGKDLFGGGIFEPNMTPLVDVSLVLVIILLVATPMALQSSIDVQKAKSGARSAEVKARVERLEITVASPESVLVNRHMVGRDAMQAIVAAQLDSSATRSVDVRCRAGVAHGTFVGVLDDLKQAGALQIAVQGR